MATPQHEIDRQHDEAKRLVAEKFPYSTITSQSQQQEIPLWKKTQSIQQRIKEAAGGGKEAEEKERIRLGPYWTTRGHVNVSALQDLIRPGYNARSSPPPAPAPPSNTTATTTTNDNNEKSNENKKNMKKQKKKKYTVADIKSMNDYWDPIHAAVKNVTIQRPSHDAWGIHKICLIFCDDFIQHVYEMPFFHKFQQAIQPILTILGIDNDSNRRMVRCILASLPPGVTIPVHEDSGEWVKYTHRIHVPILVNNPDNIVFTCGPDQDHMERIPTIPGHVFEINNQAKHFVSNCDDEYRVHLILDYLDDDSHHHPMPMLRVSERIVLEPGEVLLQTRRSIDRYIDCGKRPTPSFFILGAQKAGTTSLFEYMNQHALIVKPKNQRRETHCLDWRWKGNNDGNENDDDNDNDPKTIQEQLEHCLEFYHTSQLQWHPSCQTGDSTPSYLIDSRRVLPRLLRTFSHVSDIKFFVVCREPIQRAESHYAMVTSTTGTEQQLKTRGCEWRHLSIIQVIHDELEKMSSCGLIPYWDMEQGQVDAHIWNTFVDTSAEWDAWNLYLQRHVPLNSGSYGLLARGLYALQLHPWLVASSSSSSSNNTRRLQPAQFFVLHLEHHFAKEKLQSTMNRVWDHVNVPNITISDTDAKNTREYTSKLLQDNSLLEYLQRFFDPHNRRLYKLLTTLHGGSTFGIEQDLQIWQDPWQYENNKINKLFCCESPQRETTSCCSSNASPPAASSSTLAHQQPHTVVVEE